MKANELRIGNLIYEIVDTPENPKLKELFRVSTICELFNTLHDIDDNITSIDNCEPIPLTEEWLLNLNFNSQYKKGWIGIDVKHSNGTTTDFVLSYPKRMGMWQTFFAFEYDSYRFVELKYVHQLQNIYFALTGEELTIK
jgi:hypothetical protein